MLVYCLLSSYNYNVLWKIGEEEEGRKYSGVVHFHTDDVCHYLTEGGGTTRRDAKQKLNE